MHSAEEVSERLGCLVTHKHPCEGCPFNPHPGMPWPYGCIKGQGDIVAEARQIIREYEQMKGRNSNDTENEERTGAIPRRA